MILAIEGSPRKGGNSHTLLAAFLEGVADAGAAHREAHLRDYTYEPCLGCEQCRRTTVCTRHADGMTLLYPLVEGAQGLILVTPVHNYNVSVWIKSFLDRLYCYYDFADTRPRAWSSRLAGAGRKAVIAAIAEQDDPASLGVALPAMRLPLEALGYEVVAELPVLGLFDRGALAQHRDILAIARRQGWDLAKAL